MLTQAELKQALHYDPETGVFTRLTNGGGVRANTQAGGKDAYGHRTISVKGKRYRAARLAFLWMLGEWPPHDVDHINRDRMDDRWCNLRAATRAQNCANSGPRTGKVKGACWVQAKKRWKAQISLDGKNHHLGYFDSEQEAGEVYQQAARQAHGEFCCAT